MSTAGRPLDGAGGSEPDIRPLLVSRPSRLPPYLFVAGMALLALLLFHTLNARRQALTAPETRPILPDLARSPQPPPTLFVPPRPEDVIQRREALPPPAAALPPEAWETAARLREQHGADQGLRIQQPPLRISQPPTPPVSFAPAGQGMAADARGSAGPVLVIDIPSVEAGQGPSAAATAGAAGAAGFAQGASRVRSGRLANPSTTVPQGTSIPAVLETALDSTRPGQARALVSLDVRGFDGTKVLIPRGSRLYGEYQADLQAGQNRVLIQWTRLLRPDGVVIAIGSPAADSLGRAGVRGDVNSHLFERSFSALLQSSLDLGIVVASRAPSSGGVVVLPGSLGRALPQPPEIKPTLTVPQGRSISVLVARDLDFAAGGGR